MSLIPALFLTSSILGTTITGNTNADLDALKTKAIHNSGQTKIIVKQLDASQIKDLKQALKDLGVSSDIFNNCIPPNNGIGGGSDGETTPDNGGGDNADSGTETPDDDESNGGNNGADADKPGNGGSSGGSNDTDMDQTETKGYAAQVVKLVNAERTKAGLKNLKLDSGISAAAQVRAQEIVKSFSHTRPNGSSFATALTEQKISYRRAGENIAWGQKTPEQVVNAWMNSDGHRANILNSNFTSIGIGCYESGGALYWTQLFTS